MQSCDVAIIGASSSGLYTAGLLAKAGVEVALFEREEAIDPARRTYIITPGLERVMDEVPAGLVLHQISDLAVETPGQDVTIPLRDQDLILERNMMRKSLADRAREAGAQIHTGMAFAGFRVEEDQTRLVFDGEGGQSVVRAGTVIGADGAFSVTAREAGIPRPATVPLLQAEIHLPAGWPRGLTKVWFDVVDTRYFFWLIPESEKRAVVGLIGDPGRDIKSVLSRFMEQHSFRALDMQSGQAAMHHPRLRPWGEVGGLKVLLVGDAAGQVKVTTVGGTVTGFWGAKAVSEAVLEGKAYADALQPLKRELDLHWWIRHLLERMDNSGYDRLVENINPRVVDFLGTHDRDGMRGHFWKLPFLQPGFVPMGLKLLLGSQNHPPLPYSQDADAAPG